MVLTWRWRLTKLLEIAIGLRTGNILNSAKEDQENDYERYERIMRLKKYKHDTSQQSFSPAPLLIPVPVPLTKPIFNPWFSLCPQLPTFCPCNPMTKAGLQLNFSYLHAHKDKYWISNLNVFSNNRSTDLPQSHCSCGGASQSRGWYLSILSLFYILQLQDKKLTQASNISICGPDLCSWKIWFHLFPSESKKLLKFEMLGNLSFAFWVKRVMHLIM